LHPADVVEHSSFLYRVVIIDATEPSLISGGRLADRLTPSVRDSKGLIAPTKLMTTYANAEKNAETKSDLPRTPNILQLQPYSYHIVIALQSCLSIPQRKPKQYKRKAYKDLTGVSNPSIVNRWRYTFFLLESQIFKTFCSARGYERLFYSSSCACVDQSRSYPNEIEEWKVSNDGTKETAETTRASAGIYACFMERQQGNVRWCGVAMKRS
jgi:hypothetical protein